MKTVFIILPDHFSIRNFLYSPFINNDFKKNNIKIVFFLRNPDNHKKVESRNIKLQNIVIDKIPGLIDKLKNRFIYFLYDSLVYRFYKINNFKNLKIKEGIPKEFVINKKEDCFRLSIKFPFSGSILIYKLYYWLYNSNFLTNKIVKKYYTKYNPDLILLTNPHMPISRDFILGAKKRKVKIISYVTSWDYLTTKGPIFKDIEHFIVWNKQMKNELETIHKTKAKIDSIGPLQMDFTFKENLWDKEELFKFFNISNPERKLIVFGVYNERFGMHEPGIVKYLMEHVLEKYNLHLIMRGHPHDTSFEKRYGFTGKSNRVTLNQGYRFDRHNLEKNDDRLILNSILKNAGVVMCGPTTLTLDALRFDKPVINIAFDGDLNLPESASIKQRYYTEHYRPLLKYNGLYIVENFNEMANSIKKSLDNPGELADGRKKLRDDYLEPLDGMSSERMFNIIKEELNIN